MFIHYIHEDDRKNTQEMLYQVTQKKTKSSISIRLLNQENKSTLVKAKLIPNINHENKIISITIEALPPIDKKVINQSLNSDNTLYNHLEDTIFSISPNGIIKDINLAGERLSGYTKEELIGKSYIPFIPIIELPKVLHKIDLAKQGYIQNFDTTFYHKSKKLIHVHVSLIPAIVNNQVQKIYGISKNITQYKNTELQLQWLNIKYHNLLDNYPYGIFQVNSFGQFIEINPTGHKIVGYSKEEILNMNFMNLLHPKEIKWGSERFREISEMKDQPPTEKLTLIHKNGKHIYGNLTTIPIFMNGKVESVFGVFKDTTEEDTLIENLTSEEDTFHKLFNEVTFPIFISEITTNQEKGRFLEVNNKACEILGYCRSELIKKSFKDIIAKEYLSLRMKSLNNLQEERVTILKSMHIDKKGKKLPVELRTCISTFNNEKVFLTIANYSFENTSTDHLTAYVSDDPGKNLRVLMAQMDINSSELAELTGLTVATISNLRTGKVKKPNIETARLIADALGTKIHNIWPPLYY